MFYPHLSALSSLLTLSTITTILNSTFQPWWTFYSCLNMMVLLYFIMYMWVCNLEYSSSWYTCFPSPSDFHKFLLTCFKLNVIFSRKLTCPNSSLDQTFLLWSPTALIKRTCFAVATILSCKDSFTVNPQWLCSACAVWQEADWSLEVDTAQRSQMTLPVTTTGVLSSPTCSALQNFFPELLTLLFIASQLIPVLSTSSYSSLKNFKCHFPNLKKT